MIVLVYGNIKEEIFVKQNFDFAGSTIFYYDKCGGCSLDIHGDFIIDDKSGTQILHTDIADVWLDLQKQK